MCIAHLYLKTNVCIKFHENRLKTEEVVRTARFIPNFCHMLLPWQHNFQHMQKICLTHLYIKTNMCAKFHKSWLKTGEVVWTARFLHNFAIMYCYHGNTIFFLIKNCRILLIHSVKLYWNIICNLFYLCSKSNNLLAMSCLI